MNEAPTTTGTKYLDLLQRSDENKKAEEAQFQAQEAKLDLDKRILDTNRLIAKTKSSISQKMGQFPLDVDGIIRLQLELEGAEDGLKRANELMSTLF
jgi:hypothetical protein